MVRVNGHRGWPLPVFMMRHKRCNPGLMFLLAAFWIIWIIALPDVAAPAERAGSRVALLENEMLESGGREASFHSAAGIRVIRDVPYGKHKRQRLDVYLPRQPVQNAPVIFMVHGGAWRVGNKNLSTVVENKVAHWVPEGFVFISTNYRLLPDATPIEQARDVARAIAAAQSSATTWGAAPDKFVLMGHSAGAHLVALVATDPSLSAGLVHKPWLGWVALDSATLDVVETMEQPHLRLYDRAFARDPKVWRAASPFRALNAKTAPFLAVCSTRRDDACPQAGKFVEKATSLSVNARVLKKDLSHREINDLLGREPIYTAEVEAFLSTLDRSVSALLTR